MGCQSYVILQKNLVFSICTHDPDTGVLTDADSAPSYRVYEDETGTPLLTGTMSKLDDANTTGFYTELIAVTAANGFERAKSYTIYIEATVDSDTGGITYGFTVLAATASTPGTGLNAQTWVCFRGANLSRTFTVIDDDPTMTKAQFTVKRYVSDDDDDAILAVDTVTGLIRINGAAPVAQTATFYLASGILTVPAATMAELPAEEFHYDVKTWIASAVTVQEWGKFIVVPDVGQTVTPAP